VAVDKTSALYDYGNGEVVTSIVADESCIGVFAYLLVLYDAGNAGPLWFQAMLITRVWRSKKCLPTFSEEVFPLKNECRALISQNTLKLHFPFKGWNHV
jgi:hypothetical protein